MKKYRILGALLAACMFTAAVPVTAGAANVTTSAAVSAKLSAPTNVKAKISGTTAKLTWNKVNGADAYRVYKYNPDTKKYETYKNVSGTTCNVKGLTAG
ncbi:MAG: fibronectin type III domain-containing protein, partial [Ruminiclostridium sp.]|nr:fibronectin type III domain-containing protein [Ruminiclostridium sp.]